MKFSSLIFCHSLVPVFSPSGMHVSKGSEHLGVLMLTDDKNRKSDEETKVFNLRKFKMKKNGEVLYLNS